MADVEFTDNSAEIMKLLEKATESALEIVGGKVEGWAKRLCYPKGPNGNMMRGAAELRNSIAHQVENGQVSIGSNMQIAPYIELGTGKEYDPPPEWIQAHSEDKHSKGGVDSWWYFDENEHMFRIGLPIPAQPFLRPAINDHVEDIRAVIEGELKKTQT